MRCKVCGAELQKGQRFCMRCGAPVQKAGNGKRRSGKWIVIPLILILILAAAVGLAAVGIIPLPEGLQSIWREETEESLQEEVRRTTGQRVLGPGFTDAVIDSPEAAAAALQGAAELLGYETALDELVNSVTLPMEDQTCYQMQQYYQGIPVYGRYATVFASSEGEALGAVSDLEEMEAEISLTPSITWEQAYQMVWDYGEQHWEYRSSQMTLSDLTEDRLVIFDQDEARGAVLSYDLTVENTGEYQVIVDALTAEVLEGISLQSSILATGQSADLSFQFPVDYEEGTGEFTMTDPERNITVFAGEGHTNYKVMQEIKSYGDSVFGNTEQEDTVDMQTALRVYPVMEKIAQYYETTHHVRVPYEGLYVFVNYGSPEEQYLYANVGTNDDQETVGVIVVNTGELSWSETVLAHEYGHLVAREFSSATGSDSYIGMYEGLGDILACLETGTWSIMLDANTDRSPVTPSTYGYPETIYDANRSWEADDHAYGTVISRAAWLMKESGQFSYNQELDRLWYQTILSLPYNCSCQDLLGLLLITGERRNYTEQQLEAIRSAFSQVGIVLEENGTSGNQVCLEILERQKKGSAIDPDGERIRYFELYDDYRIRIEGSRMSGIMGLKKTPVDLELTPQDDENPGTEQFDLTLEDGNYTITVIDRANPDYEQQMTLQVRKKYEAGTFQFFGYGAEYERAPGTQLVLLDENGNALENFRMYASLGDGPFMEAALQDGCMTLEAGNYYQLLFAHDVETEEGMITEYQHGGTLRVQEGADELLEIATGFEPDVEPVSYYDFIRDELVPERGLASLEDETNIVSGQYAYESVGWESRSGIVSAQIEDLNQDGTEDLLVYSIGSWPHEGYLDQFEIDGYTSMEPKKYLYAELYSRDEKGEILFAGAERLTTMGGLSEMYLSGGIVWVSEKPYLCLEYASNALFANGAYMEYDFFEYDGDGRLTLKWKLYKSDGGSSEIAHSMLIRTENGMDQIYLEADGGFRQFNPGLTVMTGEGATYAQGFAWGFEYIGLPAVSETLEHQGFQMYGYKDCPDYLANDAVSKAAFRYRLLGSGEYSGNLLTASMQDFTYLSEQLSSE